MKPDVAQKIGDGVRAAKDADPAWFKQMKKDMRLVANYLETLDEKLLIDMGGDGSMYLYGMLFNRGVSLDLSMSMKLLTPDMALKLASQE